MKKHLIAASALLLLTSGAALAVPTHHDLSSSIDGALGKVARTNVSNLEGPVSRVREVSPVPLPAAGWMLLAGIGGIVALRRRAKA